tara:strand:+ start:417 stop:1112 length:696 start_codon:yes stop_codon:yes gene_type:complete
MKVNKVVNIINVVGKWLDLANKAESIASEKVAQVKQLDEQEPMLKMCSTFGGVKTRFPEIHMQLYLGFITKFIQDKNIKLTKVKIADVVYNFTIEDCVKSMTELKADYNPDVANYFRSSKSPLGFMRNLDTHIKEKWADFRADLILAGNPVEEVVTVVEEDTDKITLTDLEQSAKALAQQYKTLGNKSTKSNPSISKQEVLQPREKLKKLAEEFLESCKSKYKFKDLVKML